MSNYSFRIDPIRAQSALHPDLAVMLEAVPGWSHDDWKDVLDRPAFRRHPDAIIDGNDRGVYGQQQAVHG